MISDAKLDNYILFCQMAESYGVCDKMSGDDKHRRIHMGKDGNSRTRYYGQLRKDYMKIYYKADDEVRMDVKGGSVLNVPLEGSNYDYYSDIVPEDYDAFLKFVCHRLGRLPKNESLGINHPLKPKRVIYESDEITKYQCPRCDAIFKQSQRCPECGQLLYEES